MLHLHRADASPVQFTMWSIQIDQWSCSQNSQLQPGPVNNFAANWNNCDLFPLWISTYARLCAKVNDWPKASTFVCRNSKHDRMSLFNFISQSKSFSRPHTMTIQKCLTSCPGFMKRLRKKWNRLKKDHQHRWWSPVDTGWWHSVCCETCTPNIVDATNSRMNQLKP